MHPCFKSFVAFSSYSRIMSWAGPLVHTWIASSPLARILPSVSFPTTHGLKNVLKVEKLLTSWKVSWIWKMVTNFFFCKFTKVHDIQTCSWIRINILDFKKMFAAFKKCLSIQKIFLDSKKVHNLSIFKDSKNIHEFKQSSQNQEMDMDSKNVQEFKNGHWLKFLPKLRKIISIFFIKSENYSKK